MPEKGTDVYEYTYEDPLPVDYDASATHVLMFYAERDPVGRHGESISNIVYSFVPDGSAVETTRNSGRPIRS
jgi:hypothetical protein